MALQKTRIEERFGSVIPDAYIKFVHMRWSHVDMKVIATFSVFASKQALLDGKEAIENISVEMPGLTAGNIQAQAYIAMKQKPEYVDAIDVLEEGQTLPPQANR